MTTGSGTGVQDVCPRDDREEGFEPLKRVRRRLAVAARNASQLPVLAIPPRRVPPRGITFGWELGQRGHAATVSAADENIGDRASAGSCETRPNLIVVSIAERLVDWLPLLWFGFVVLLVFGLWTSGLVPGLLRRIRKFGGFGIEFEFSEDSAKQTRDSIESSLDGVRKTIRRELEADVRARALQSGLKSVLEESRLGTSDNYRATIHIPDPLYDNWLYQLLDYHPKGAGHGRAFSNRAGIIGLAWRLHQDQEWSQSSGISLDELIRQWGMTHREAAERRATDGFKEMLAVPLTDSTQSRPVGLLYLDSKEQGFLGRHEADRLALAEELRVIYNSRLSESLSELVESAMRRSPQLSLEAQ